MWIYFRHENLSVHNGSMRYENKTDRMTVFETHYDHFDKKIDKIES